MSFVKENPIQCMDCLRNIQLKEVTACPDKHLYNIKCCTKFICIDYCVFQCEICNKNNKLLNKDIDIYDNFYNGYKCFNCNNENIVYCTFYGDLKTMCDRYCKMKCIPDIII